MTLQFIGYATLEDLLRDLLLSRIVYVFPSANPADAGHGITRYTHYVEVAQRWDDEIAYWRMPVCRTEYVAGTPLRDDAPRREAAAHAAYEIVRRWLKQRGFDVRTAVFAHARDLVLLDGHTGTMRYDQEAHTWVSDQPALPPEPISDAQTG